MLSGEELLGVLWRRKLVFLATFLAVLAGVAAFTATRENVYRTSAYLFVTTAGEATGDYEQVQINQVVTKSYAELLQTRNVANLVAEELDFDTTGEIIQRVVKVEPISQSQLITVSATGETPQRAADIANTYAETFTEHVRELAGPAERAPRVTVAEPAPIITNKIRPRPRLYMLVGAILAALIAAGAAVLRNRVDQRLRLEEDTAEIHEVPVIGRIPRVSGSSVRAREEGDTDDAGSRQLDEAFRFLLANLAFANDGVRPATIAVVSTNQAEGKSTTCVSLGLAAAELGANTLLVDADLRHPRLASRLGLPVEARDNGLSTFLLDKEAVALSELSWPTGVPDLSVVPAGPIPPNSAALLGSQGLASFVERASRIYDLTLFDTPPMTVGADAVLLSAHVEGVVLVIDSKSTRRGPLERVIEQLRRADVNLLGIVVNRTEERLRDYYGPRENGDRSRRARKRGSDAPQGADAVV